MIESVTPPLRPRALSRYYAFIALYQMAVVHESVERSLRLMWDTDEARLNTDELIRAFATQLAKLTVEHLDTVDSLIEQYARQRALHRLPMVDLALLRLGCAELLYLSDVPPAVTINEIVELSKQFSSDESPAFMNAVLDQVKSHRDEVPASEKVESRWVVSEASQ
ncbi:MAG: transcription antitermination factor NusB [Candidatus Poribacteria bacterium]|nr:transcription antitermination factor NusB [Candidatus Poribacteria bacterium]